MQQKVMRLDDIVILEDDQSNSPKHSLPLEPKVEINKKSLKSEATLPLSFQQDNDVPIIIDLDELLKETEQEIPKQQQGVPAVEDDYNEATEIHEERTSADDDPAIPDLSDLEIIGALEEFQKGFNELTGSEIIDYLVAALKRSIEEYNNDQINYNSKYWVPTQYLLSLLPEYINQALTYHILNVLVPLFEDFGDNFKFDINLLFLALKEINAQGLAKGKFLFTDAEAISKGQNKVGSFDKQILKTLLFIATTDVFQDPVVKNFQKKLARLFWRIKDDPKVKGYFSPAIMAAIENLIK